MNIVCHRCGEELTAPHFHNGKPYGWTCIKLVNPSAKKDKSANRWIIPQSNNLDRTKGKQSVTIIHGVCKYVVSIRFDTRTNTYWTLDRNVIIDDSKVYINKNVIHY